jgi:hypothetical protein
MITLQLRQNDFPSNGISGSARAVPSRLRLRFTARGHGLWSRQLTMIPAAGHGARRRLITDNPVGRALTAIMAWASVWVSPFAIPAVIRVPRA